jgi:hypothetical protein
LANNSLALNLTIEARENEKGDYNYETLPMERMKNDYILDKSRGVS